MKYDISTKIQYNRGAYIFIYNYNMEGRNNYYQADIIVMGVEVKKFKFEKYCTIDDAIRECIKWCELRF